MTCFGGDFRVPSVTGSLACHFSVAAGFVLRVYAYAIVFCALFVVTTRTPLSSTFALVLFGIFCYWFLVHSERRGESPSDALWIDRTSLITVLDWGLPCVYLLRQP